MLTLLVAALLQFPQPIRPEPSITPGATRPHVTRDSVCRPRAATDARHVLPSVRRAVLQAYHIPARVADRYELDHLISLELGGSNDARNLWPETYSGQWNAHRKDALENRLHHLVCAGRLPLGVAQGAIRADWIAAYRRYAAGRLTHLDRSRR